VSCCRQELLCSLRGGSLSGSFPSGRYMIVDHNRYFQVTTFFVLLAGRRIYTHVASGSRLGLDFYLLH
jgi:hypothetical protein